MNRSIIYTPELTRAYDQLKAWVRTAKAQNRLALDVVGGYGQINAGGSTTGGIIGVPPFSGVTGQGGMSSLSNYNGPLVQGFAINFFSSLTCYIDAGTIYWVTPTDLTNGTSSVIGAGTIAGYGDLSGDSEIALSQFNSTKQYTFTLSSSAGAGNSNYYLVACYPTQQDLSDSDDPNLTGALSSLPFYNSANPSQPYIGVGGSGTSLATNRQAAAQVVISSPVVGTSGQLATFTSSWTVGGTNQIPLYIIEVPNGVSSLSLSNAAVVGRGGAAVQSTFTYNTAPFLAGLTQQHHLGLKGTAPKIDGGTEWFPLSTVFNNFQKISNVANGVATNDVANLANFAINGLTVNGSSQPAGVTLSSLSTIHIPAYTGAPATQGTYIIEAAYTAVIQSSLPPGNSAVWTVQLPYNSLTYKTISISWGGPGIGTWGSSVLSSGGALALVGVTTGTAQVQWGNNGSSTYAAGTTTIFFVIRMTG